MNLLWFSRNPYSDVLFKLFAVGVLGLMGLGSPLVLPIAIIVALTIPSGFRSAKLDAKLRRDLPQLKAGDEDNLLIAIFKTLKQSGLETLAFAQRYTLAKDLLQRHQESHAKWFTRVALSVLYSVSLLGGMVGAVGAFIPMRHWHHIASIASGDKNAFHKQQIEEADKALQENPKDVKVYLKRGVARRMMKDYAGAIADANQVIQLDPSSSKGYSLRSLVRRSSGDIEGAEIDWQKAERLIQEQHIEKASQSLKANRNDVEAYLDRAYAYHQLHNYKAALKDYNRALNLDEQNSWAYLGRGGTRYELKDYKGAITDANQSIRLQSDLAEAYDLRGKARLKLKDNKEATADKQKAKALRQNEDREEN